MKPQIQKMERLTRKEARKRQNPSLKSVPWGLLSEFPVVQDVDVLIEVRDARAPFSSAQFVGNPGLMRKM